MFAEYCASSKLRTKAYSEDFDGSIDEVRVYNRALSADDIARLASGTGPSTAQAEFILQD
ncbi:LamG domain-containing protein, partial [bacterium]|nr:LamG domain-containing protein [bacterium]